MQRERNMTEKRKKRKVRDRIEFEINKFSQILY